MEIIKKTIKQLLTTGTTTGCTGTCRVIIPITSSGVTHNFKILLTQETEDIGFFDAYIFDNAFDYIKLSGITSGITEQNTQIFKSVLSGGTTLAASGLPIAHNDGNVTGSTIHYVTYTVSGECTSRLSELRKYTISGFTLQYVSGGTPSIDGVDYLSSISGVSVTYWLGGIQYIDDYIGSAITTTFNFIGLGLLNFNFINKPIYKNPQKENIISNPKIDNDVFIIRQELSAFENNYRLEHIKSLIDLDSYAGGKYFNIVKNG